jgi:hypothetical protein
MDDIDVRQLRGRAVRFALAAVIGVMALAFVLPTRGIDQTSVLLLAGAVVIALAAYEVLGWLSSSRATRTTSDLSA